jgi:outer membrane protein OmpA-like peptidoglycan-associated protein
MTILKFINIFIISQIKKIMFPWHNIIYSNKPMIIKMKHMKTMIRFRNLILLFVLVVSVSCNTSRVFKGGAIGAGAGGAIGGAIGSRSDNTAQGAIIGAAIGGTAGALIGKYMDKQAEELEKDLEGAEIERVGEGIKVTFDSGILFDFDSSTLTAEASNNITEMAKILQKYEDTNILIEGHTDSRGEERYNQNLSESRAKAVANELSQHGIKNARVKQIGYGENQPVADNETEEGRQLNRRVEVAIFANEDLKKAAEDGDLVVQ